jgi:NAD(P)-dependent dehydrogenase (short-subunit alcohol dehydrogenase family)
VYITGRREEVLENAAKQHTPNPEVSSGQIVPITCDVTAKDSLEELVQQISSNEKYLSLLVAAAGVAGPKGISDSDSASTLKEKLWNAESSEEWGSTYNTNVTSIYFTTVACLPLLQSAPRDHTSSAIVISSMSGMMRHSQGHFAYNAAKAATIHVSAMMSKEFAATGVRINSIAPGYFPSEMTMKASDDRQKSHMPDDKVKGKGHSVPAGRPGRDEEMAMAIAFLARCGYVNGEVVKLDGGVMNEVGGT